MVSGDDLKMMSHDYNIKVIILGDAAVGKTSLRKCYMGESFQQNYLMTIGADFSLKEVSFEEGKIRFQLWDIAGEIRNTNILAKHCMGATGAIIVYSRVDRNTVNALQEWIDLYYEYSGFEGKNNPILLLGNKTDLVGKHDISDEEHLHILQKLREDNPKSTIDGMTTSALTGENVDTAFNNLGRLCYNYMRNEYSGHMRALHEDYHHNFPFAALFAMNENIGPLWVSSSPRFENLDRDRILSAMIKLMVSMDGDDVAAHGSITGQVTWPDPQCTFAFVGFAISSDQARGGREIYLMGLGIRTELMDTMESIRPALNGILQSSLNNFARIRHKDDLNFITTPMHHSYTGDIYEEIENLLDQMKQRAQESLI